MFYSDRKFIKEFLGTYGIFRKNKERLREYELIAICDSYEAALYYIADLKGENALYISYLMDKIIDREMLGEQNDN